MEEVISIHERRRRAPLHYIAKAENARFAARSIWTMAQRNDNSADEIGYFGTPKIALGEAFRREASLALELIIKAIVAQRIESGVAMPHVVKVRPSHDLASLWSDAGLPKLPPGDQHRLLIAKRILYWSGRYAAPIKDEEFAREQEALDKLAETEPLGKLRIKKLRSFTWDDFARIYRVAAVSFWGIRNADPSLPQSN